MLPGALRPTRVISLLAQVFKRNSICSIPSHACCTHCFSEVEIARYSSTLPEKKMVGAEKHIVSWKQNGLSDGL